MISQAVITTAIQKELGSFFSTEAHTDSDIVRYIDSAVNYVASYRDFSFLIETQTVVYTTPLVSQTITYTVKVLGVNGDPAINILRKADWFFPDLRTNAICIDGDEFIANDAGTYEILYVKLPDKLTTATAGTLDIPPQFEQVIIDLSIMYGYKDLKYYDKASAKLGAANAELGLLAQRITNPTPRQTRILSRNHRI